MKPLLGRITTIGVVRKHGEVIATQALSLLLDDQRLSEAFTNALASRVQHSIARTPRYVAEATQDDRARPDLEGLLDGMPIVKVEAKFGAALLPAQLECYLQDQRKRLGPDAVGFLLVVVPESRRAEGDRVIASLGRVRQVGPGGWEFVDRRQFGVVMTWPEVCTAIEAALVDRDDVEADQSDLRQFRAFTEGLGAAEPEPFSPWGSMGSWVDRREDYERVVDRVSRNLPSAGRLYPMAVERRSGFRRRYRSLEDRPDPTYFALGVRDPIGGARTPIWLRYHRETPRFGECVDRLRSSRYAALLVQEDEHVWIPLFPPLEVGMARVVDEITDVVKAIDETARGELDGGTAEPVRIKRLSAGESMGRFDRWEVLRWFEGGTLSTAEADGTYVLVAEEHLLHEICADGATGRPACTVYAFYSAADRWAYAASRGLLG